MRVILHGERNEGGFGWWAETPDHPDFSAAADDLAELKVLIKEAVELYSWTPPEFEFARTGPAPGDAVPTGPDDGSTPSVVRFAAA